MAAFNKLGFKRTRQEIRRILWEFWDPIGVRELGGPDDEYDGYVDGVYSLLTNGASDESIAEHLLRMETERMGLSARLRADVQPTVTALRQIV